MWLRRAQAGNARAGVTLVPEVGWRGNSFEDLLNRRHYTYMGVIANCTTPRFRELWGPENIDNGFLNRAMIVGGKRRKIMSNPPSACEGSRQALVSRIHDLIDTIEPKAQENGGKIRIRFASLEAAERWDWYYFFFQAEGGIRDLTVTGVQTCALPI